MEFIGLQNYIRLFGGDKIFYRSLYNVFLLMAIAIILQLSSGLILAVIIKDLLKKTRGIFQLANFLPYITTPVSIGILFSIIFDWRYGTVNQILMRIGLITEQINWLGKPGYARFVVILMLWWKYYGYHMVFVMAGLSTIPESLYEAARIDGANWRVLFFRITLPLLKPVLTFVVTMSIIGGFQMFDEPHLLFSGPSMPLGGPEGSVLTPVLNFYDNAFQRFNLGYGASIAYGLFVIIFIFSMITMSIMNRGNKVWEN
jgi:cellobiose transport system permease protein